MEETNLAARLKELPTTLFATIADARRICQEAGFGLYLAGGAVRDLLLRKQVCDIDLAVDGEAITLATTLAREKGVKAVIHRRFATAKLGFSAFTLDIATLRSESYARPGALPTVTPTSLRQDLKRRDFSINAMAVSLNCDDYGKLIDYYSGRADLEKGLVRVLYDNSFSDDATRIWRALRYEQRLGFKLEENTLKLLKRDVEMLKTISGERLRYELECILREVEPQRVLKRATELGVLRSLHPTLRGDDWLIKRFRRAAAVFPPDKLPNARFCLLVYRLEDGEVEKLINRLRPDRRTTRLLKDCVKVRQVVGSFEAGSSPADIYHHLEGLRPLAVEVALVAENAATAKKALGLFIKELRHVKVELNGKALKEIGIREGKVIDRALNALLEARLANLVSSKEEEEAFVRNYIGKQAK